jgi:inosose dehydratase
MSSTFLDRVGSAPISWGICEVPGWGAQLPVERFLSEMVSLGLMATELGEVGYLPTDPVELRDLLGRFDMTLTGGFNALVLHDDARTDEMLAQARSSADRLAAAGATDFVTCAVSDPDDWQRPALDEAEWATLFANLERLDDLCRERGLVQAFHPHVDSVVETAPEIQRVLDSTTVGFVLETGHMLIGGLDPLAFAVDHLDRVALVHLKDVTLHLIEPLNRDELTLMEAVQAGIFPSLGAGGAPIADVISTLEDAGYRGRYVIEQDAALTDGLPADGDGPVRDVQSSVAYLQSIAKTIGNSLETNNKGERPV